MWFVIGVVSSQAFRCRSQTGHCFILEPVTDDLPQIIDVEHASMHMCYPLLPNQSPSPVLQQTDSHQGDAYSGLAQMMHQGLSHFVGRGLPSIWSFLSATDADFALSGHTPFTERDSQVIRLWAKGLDNWLVRYNGASRETHLDKIGDRWLY